MSQPVERKYWNPTGTDGAPATLSEAVGQALGAASMCWENVAAAGVFDSTRCADVLDGLMAYLSDWDSEQRKRSNEATAAKTREVIAVEIEAALAADEADSDVTSGEAIWEQGGYRRGLAAAADIARGEP